MSAVTTAIGQTADDNQDAGQNRNHGPEMVADKERVIASHAAHVVCDKAMVKLTSLA
jgi:hypothetical protein